MPFTVRQIHKGLGRPRTPIGPTTQPGEGYRPMGHPEAPPIANVHRFESAGRLAADPEPLV
jgi:hypothetical protein